MCEEESDDSEAVAKLLEINDSIHRTIERYKLVKKGDVEAAAKIPKGTLGTTTGVGKNAANELSLIDFGPEATPNGGPNGTPSTQSQTTSVEDDLLGLSIMDDKPYGQSGGIALGYGSNAGIPGPALLSSTTQHSSARSNIPVNALGPTSTAPPIKPNYDAFSTLSSSRPASKPATPSPSLPQPKQSTPHATPAMDPFAALVSPSPRAGSPAHQRVTSNPAPASSSLLDLMDNSSAPSAVSKAEKTREDDWNFASSLPEAENSQPMSHHFQVVSSSIRIDFVATRQAHDQTIHVAARFSNDTAQAITGVHFQVAVEKVSQPRGNGMGNGCWLREKQGYSLKLKPQTGRNIAPHQPNGLEQEILLTGVPVGKGSTVKMRYKVSYQSGAQPHEEQGNLPSLGIA
jgi:ADP-ribosylation factor-binding protein GGA